MLCEPHGMMIERAKKWARSVKQDVIALYIAGRDARTPWYAKVVALAVAIYAISPIDLIPDVVPILGYLDDLLLVPLGILLAVRLIPPLLMAEYREAAAKHARLGSHWGGAMVVIALWTGALGLVAWWAFSS